MERKTRISNVEVNGKKGMIVHDKLCADGPIDEDGNRILDENGDPLEGPNDDLVEIMRYNYYPYLCNLVHTKITTDDGDKYMPLPRYGVLSTLAETTPVIVYDHPRFKQIANTAFTDGVHVFVDADFMRKLMQQEKDANFAESGVVFLLLHELMHKLYMHVDRLKSFDPRLANIAEDYVINGKLIKNFSLMPVPLLRETGVGMSPEESNKYFKMAEETVAEMLLMKERNKKSKKKENQSGDGDEDSDENDGQENSQGNGSGNGMGQGQGKGKGKSGSGKGGSGDDEESDDNKKGSKNGQGGEDGEDEYSPIHHITPEELSQILEEEGLSESVGDRLKIPRPDDADGLAKKKDRNKNAITDAIQNALAANVKANGQLPGSHIAEEAASLIDDLNTGMLNWVFGMKELILGGGMKEVPSEESPNDMYFLDDGALGDASFGLNQIYLPGRVPAESDEVVLALVDTSGSTMGEGMRESFLSEILGMQDSTKNQSTAKEVIIWSADTVLRGAPEAINRQNMGKFLNEGVKVFGNGGTDFSQCLYDAVNHPLMRNKKIKNVVYFTDCCDAPPRREDYAEFLDSGGKITWVTTPGMWNEAFNRGVDGWSTVYAIERGTTIDLDRNEEVVNTRKNRV